MSTATTRACPKCNSQVAADTKFCPNCGTAVSGIFSGGGTPMDGTAVLGVEQVDTLFPILQEATLGDYDLYGELGRGGMAAVYLALDLSLNRKVAIKTMLPDLVSRTGMVDRFKREAQTAAALSHPHIIQIFGVKQTKSLVYFVMKYIEGRSLESVIIERGKLDVDLTRVILSQVGGALAFAHRKGVVHRDMKPANIMLEEDGWAIVTDFGIAKVQEAQNLTATGTAIGTPHYMSPEQFHNKAVTGASDQYSLGVLAYEMLAGKKPFDGGTYAEIITQHLFEAPPDLRTVNPDVPEHVNDVIRKMMAKDPAERFPDLDTAIHAFGTQPTKKENDVVRTQMISLAKSGPQKKLRLSVPMSPIPATKKREAPAPTAIEPNATPAKRSPKQKAAAAAAEAGEKSGGGAGKWAAILLLVLGGGGYFAYSQGMIPGLQSKPAQVASNAQTPAAPAATGDSAAQQAGAPEAAAPDNTARLKHVQDSLAAVAAQRMIDSAQAADAERRRATKRRADSIDAARRVAASRPAATETKTAPAAAREVQAPQPQVVAPPPVPQIGWVRIGTRAPGAFLYINGGVEAALSRVRFAQVPSGNVRLEIKVDGCAPYDTTFQVRAGDSVTVGNRMPKCP
jgi:serine/threonine protein kinase